MPTILLGFMSFSGLLLTYGLNTWLPRIMESYGFNATYSLTFLLLLNTGAVIGGLVIAALAGPTATAATAFYVFAGVAVFGALVCALVSKHD